MPKILIALAAVFLFTVAPCIASAAPLKTYVTEFNVSGVPNRDELKVALQGLLSSRLNPGQVQLVEKPEKAELLVSGSYALFGKMFSIDVLLKNAANGAMTKVFEQGESQDDLIPAFSRLAQKVDRAIASVQPVIAETPPPLTPALPVPAPAAAKAVAPAPVVAYKVAAPVATVEESYVVKSDAPRRNTPGSWTSNPLDGVFSSVALGRTLPAGEREIFIAGGQSIRYLRKGADLKQVVEVGVPASAKILTIDTADLDRDGIPEIYVSIVDRKTVSSRVYQPTESGLELVADNQPWLFRGAGLDYTVRTVFAQGVSSTGEYQSGIAEMTKSGRSFGTKNSRTLPRQGNIYNFSRFRDASGAEKVVVVDEDGYLVLSAADGNQLWKSSDKFGGSETYFNYESVAQLRAKGDKYRWNFLEQRITVMPDGILVMPRNEGSFSVGNNRSYSKHSLFGLEWSGALLREAWHTRQTPSYLADYAYDAATRELVLLEVVQKEGLFGSGITVISINKLD